MYLLIKKYGRLFNSILAINIFLSAVPLYSQYLRFTVVGEPQISWFITDKINIKSEGAVIGRNAGLVSEFCIAPNYAFSTGLTISNLGGKLRFNEAIEYETADGPVIIPQRSIINYHLRYVSIPLSLKFITHEIGYSTFFVNLGLNPMVNIRSRGTDSKNILYHDDISQEIRTINTSYFFMAGINYSLGISTALTGGLGYSAGFTDVTSNSSDRINMRAVTLRIGLLF